jgi:hypothetical protein
MRAFAAQVEALDRLRRGGQQIVRVEHVTVAAGAKAIIGPVTNHTGELQGQQNFEATPCTRAPTD